MLANTNLPVSGPFRNLVLSSLSPELLGRLLPHLVRVDLPAGTLMVKAEEPIEWLYFLERGMASITAAEPSGTAVEVGIVGREGLLGMQAVMGRKLTASTVVMQGRGAGFRMRTSVIKEERINGEFLHAIQSFLFTLLEQTMQLVLCNRLHPLEARLARWLLMASDTMETEFLELTQEFLAQMLGAGRPGVTLAAGALQRSGLITYNRGHVQILNRAELQDAACDCYAIIRGAYAAAFPEL